MLPWLFALAVVLVLAFLGWLWISSGPAIQLTYQHGLLVDEEGNFVRDLEWTRAEPPIVYPTDGLSHLPPYIARLLASKARWTSLGFSVPGQSRGGSLRKTEEGLSLHFIFRDEHEAKVRGFFAARGIAPTKDYVASHGRIPNSPTLVGWPIEGDADAILALCQAVLREAYDFRDDEPLAITYEESR